jgi:hypothetical protein
VFERDILLIKAKVKECEYGEYITYQEHVEIMQECTNVSNRKYLNDQVVDSYVEFTNRVFDKIKECREDLALENKRLKESLDKERAEVQRLKRCNQKLLRAGDDLRNSQVINHIKSNIFKYDIRDEMVTAWDRAKREDV